MGNPALPDDDLISLLPRLRRVPSHELREAVARSGRIRAEAAQALVRDREVRVRAALARNRAIPCDLLTQLSVDPDPFVRLCIVGNTRASMTSPLPPRRRF